MTKGESSVMPKRRSEVVMVVRQDVFNDSMETIDPVKENVAENGGFGNNVGIGENVGVVKNIEVDQKVDTFVGNDGNEEDKVRRNKVTFASEVPKIKDEDDDGEIIENKNFEGDKDGLVEVKVGAKEVDDDKGVSGVDMRSGADKDKGDEKTPKKSPDFKLKVRK